MNWFTTIEKRQVIMNNDDISRQRNLVNEETNKYTYFISDNENEIEEIIDLLKLHGFENGDYCVSYGTINVSSLLKITVDDLYPHSNKHFRIFFVIQGQHHDEMLDLILNEIKKGKQ